MSITAELCQYISADIVQIIVLDYLLCYTPHQIKETWNERLALREIYNSETKQLSIFGAKSHQIPRFHILLDCGWVFSKQLYQCPNPLHPEYKALLAIPTPWTQLAEHLKRHELWNREQAMNCLPDPLCS